MSDQAAPVTRVELNALAARVAALEHAQGRFAQLPVLEGDGTGEALSPHDPVAESFEGYLTRVRARESEQRRKTE